MRLNHYLTAEIVYSPPWDIQISIVSFCSIFNTFWASIKFCCFHIKGMLPTNYYLLWIFCLFSCEIFLYLYSLLFRRPHICHVHFHFKPATVPHVNNILCSRRRIRTTLTVFLDKNVHDYMHYTTWNKALRCINPVCLCCSHFNINQGVTVLKILMMWIGWMRSGYSLF